MKNNPETSLTVLSVILFPSVELQKANLEAQNTQTPGGGTTPGGGSGATSPSNNSTNASPLASAIPLAQLLSKPGALNALSSLTALGGLTELLGGGAGAAATALPVQTTGVHRSHKPFTPRLRSPSAPGPIDSGKFKSERAKYNPYWVGALASLSPQGGQEQQQQQQQQQQQTMAGWVVGGVASA